MFGQHYMETKKDFRKADNDMGRFEQHTNTI